MQNFLQVWDQAVSLAGFFIFKSSVSAKHVRAVREQSSCSTIVTRGKLVNFHNELCSDVTLTCSFFIISLFHTLPSILKRVG